MMSSAVPSLKVLRELPAQMASLLIMSEGCVLLLLLFCFAFSKVAYLIQDISEVVWSEPTKANDKVEL